MSKLVSRLKFVKIKDVLAVIPFVFAVLPAIILRIVRQNIWLICEEENEARDNGYWFYKYVRENYPRIDAVYAINKKSPDYQKVLGLGKVIQYGSFLHWVYYLTASKNISSQKGGKPNAALCYFLEICGIIKNTRVFLQHGIILNSPKFLHYEVTKFALFVCGAKPEYEYVSKNFHYPEGIVKLLGLCRFDNLYISNSYKQNQILIMPTWRGWIARETGLLNKSGKNISFQETEYFTAWNGLLQNNDFLTLLEKYDLYAKFYPHRNMQKYIHEFNSINNRIIIADWQQYDVQELLKESAFLITDYSSISFDFAYMKKPLLYYQFDQQEFREKQYEEGYFSYENNGFGEVALTALDLVEKLSEYAQSGFSSKDVYLKRIEDFYTFNDNNNCERNFRAILDL